MTRKKSPRPFEGLSVTSRGFHKLLELTMDDRREADIYSLKPGDMVRIDVAPQFDSNDTKFYSPSSFFFYKYSFGGKISFLANYQSGLTEHTCKIEDIKVMDGGYDGHFAAINIGCRKDKKFEDKGSKAYWKRWGLMKRVWDATPTCDYM